MSDLKPCPLCKGLAEVGIDVPKIGKPREYITCQRGFPCVLRADRKTWQALPRQSEGVRAIALDQAKQISNAHEILDAAGVGHSIHLGERVAELDEKYRRLESTAPPQRDTVGEVWVVTWEDDDAATASMVAPGIVFVVCASAKARDAKLIELGARDIVAESNCVSVLGTPTQDGTPFLNLCSTCKKQPMCDLACHGRQSCNLFREPPTQERQFTLTPEDVREGLEQGMKGVEQCDHCGGVLDCDSCAQRDQWEFLHARVKELEGALEGVVQDRNALEDACRNVRSERDALDKRAVLAEAALRDILDAQRRK